MVSVPDSAQGGSVVSVLDSAQGGSVVSVPDSAQLGRLCGQCSGQCTARAALWSVFRTVHS